MTDKVDSSTGEIPDNVIKGAIDNRDIDPIVGLNLMQSQKRDTEKADEGQFKYVSALAHDPVAWRGTKPEEYANQLTQEAANIKSPTVRQRALDDINRELDSVHKQGFTSDGPQVRTQIEMMKQNHEAITGAVPLPGRRAGQTTYQKGGADAVKTMSDADFREKYGPKAKKEDVISKIGAYEESENRAYAERQAKFMEVVHANPEKANDPDWLTDQRQKIEAPHIEAKVKDTLGGHRGGEYNSPEDVGKAFKGGQLTREQAKQVLKDRFGIE